MAWTHFWDMNSGGGRKEKFDNCYIEAPIAEAKVIFYNRFGHNPERVSCTCCGEDYSINEHKTLGEASAYQRNCLWNEKKKCYVNKPDKSKTWAKFVKLVDYRKQKGVCIISKADIKKSERVGDVPSEGYVWV